MTLIFSQNKVSRQLLKCNEHTLQAVHIDWHNIEYFRNAYDEWISINKYGGQFYDHAYYV